MLAPTSLDTDQHPSATTLDAPSNQHSGLPDTLATLADRGDKLNLIESKSLSRKYDNDYAASAGFAAVCRSTDC